MSSHATQPAVPKSPRFIVPDVPLHLTQRGVDRCPTFLADNDYAMYLWALREASRQARCSVHAYALMTNHVHLLITPEDVQGPARMMRSLGRRYVRYFNDRYRRSGSLWEGRYRSVSIDSTTYLFACSRYIELNPVRAGLTADPAKYAWSSYRCNARGEEDPILSPHREYVALGTTRSTRCRAYDAMFGEELSPSLIATMRAALNGRPKLHESAYRQAVAALFDGAAPTLHRSPSQSLDSSVRR